MPRALWLCAFLPLAAVGACGSSPDSSPADLDEPAYSRGLGGVRLFPADNPWNQDISQFPVHPKSAVFINSIGANTGLHPDFGTRWNRAPNGIPYCVVKGDQPRVPVSFTYSDESDPGPYPIPPDAPIEGGPNGQGDRHVIVVDRTNLKLYEMFNAFPRGNGWVADSGAVFDLRSNRLRPDFWTSADAAGLPILAGLVRYDEVMVKGEIRHALRFTAARTRRAFIHPATHFAGSSTDPNLPPMGLRLRLKKGYNITGFPAEVQVILRALKTYGMFLADNGSNWFISGAPHPHWNDEALGEIRDVKGSAFEVVYTGEPITG